MSKKKDWKSPTDYLIEAYTNKLINDYKQDDEKEQERQRQRALSSPSTSVPTNSSTSTKNSPQTPQTGSQSTPAERDLFKITGRRHTVTDRRRGISKNEKTQRSTAEYGTRVNRNENDRFSNTVKGAGKQWLGGQLSGVGTYLQDKESIARGYNNLKAEDERPQYSLRSRDEAEKTNVSRIRDARLKEGVDKSKAERDFTIDPNTFTQKTLRKGDSLIESGTADIEKAKEGANGFEKFLIDNGSQMIQWAGDAGLRAIPVVGQVLSMTAFMNRAGGMSAYQGRQEGMNAQQQYNYQMASALMEGISELTFQSIGALRYTYGKGAFSLADKMTNKVASGGIVQRLMKTEVGKSLVGNMARLGGGAIEEGLEEVETDLVEPVMKYLIKKSEDPMAEFEGWDLKQMGYDFLMGATMGGVLGSADVARGVSQDLKIVNSDAYNDGLATSLIKQASVQGRTDGNGRILPTNAEILAQQMQTQLDEGKRIEPVQIRMLQEAIGESTMENEEQFTKKMTQEYDKAQKSGDLVQMEGTRLESQGIDNASTKLVNDAVEKARQVIGENATQEDAEAVAGVTTGIASTNEIDTVLAKPELKKAVETIVNEGADAESAVSIPVNNAEARDVLENLTAVKRIANRNTILKDVQAKNAEIIKSSVDTMSEGGKNLFASRVEFAQDTIGGNRDRNLEIYRDRFSRLYTDGNTKGADFETSYKRIIGSLDSEALKSVFTEDFARQIFDEGKKAIVTDTAKETAKSRAEEYANRKGGVTFENNNENLISSRERDELQKFAERVGVEINVVKSLSKDASGKALMSRTGKKLVVNGKYQDGVITIASDAQNKLITVAKHELTHHLKETSPEMYQKLEDFVFERWYHGNAEEMEDEIARYTKLYSGQGLDRDGIREEIIADASEAFFTDEGAIQDAISFSEKLGRAIHDGIKTMLDAFLGLQDADSRRMRGYGGFLKDLGILQEAERMWLEALEDTQQRKRNARGNVTAEDYVDASTQYTTSDEKHSLVESDDEIERLNSEPTQKSYRAMALIDGKLYPPMATRVKDGNGKWVLQQGADIGQWIKSDITTDHRMFNSKGQFLLKKDNGGSPLEVAYNPYIHSSDVMLNDQFASAHKRPNLVVVEGEIPRSELENGKRAEHDLDDGRHIKAKDPTGTVQWKAGVVQSDLTGTRTVFLTNHFKPTRVVPDSEVARSIQKMVAGTDVVIPYNVVTPNLRQELQKLGVKMEQSKQKGYQVDLNAKYSVTPEEDQAYMDAVNRGDMETAQRMVEQEARKRGYNSPLLFHGTRSFGFTRFDLSHGYDWTPTFATNNKQTAETYSGETNRGKINERSRINIDNLQGEQLLSEAKKHLKRYSDFKVMTESQKANEAEDARNGIKSEIKAFRDFIEDNKYAFDDEKMSITARMIDALNAITEASENDDIWDSWEKYQDAVWDFKWADESLFDEFLKSVNEHSLAVYKNRIDDLTYDGTLFYNDRLGLEYVFDNQVALELDAELHKGIYSLYGNIDNMLVIDAEGSNWNQIIPPDELNLYGVQKTRDIAEEAKSLGYSGVLFKNLKDNGGETAYNGVSDVYVFFNANALKSADPVTYDDDGNVIPLSKRFNEKNEDIRYSVTEDSDGNKLSEGQREYFGNSKIVDSKGNLKVMYHGSPNDFDTFDIKRAKAGLYGRGFYFTEDKSRASQYGKTYGVYLDVETPLQTGTHDITKAQLKNFIKVLAEDEDYGIENYGYGATVDSVLKSIWGKDDFAMLQDLNATAVGDFAEAVKLFNKVNGTSYDGIVAPTETIAFYPEQIKETSNKKPTKNPNMKFSVTEPVEETKDLLAVHNLKAEDLRGALDLGGFPMPSIAIIKADAGHNAYGEYSAVFDKSTIDPSVTKKNVVYGGDAWTPTFPRMQYKANDRVSRKISQLYYDRSRDLGYETMRPLQRLANEPNEELDFVGGEAELKEAYKKNKKMMRMFLRMNNNDVEDVVNRTEDSLSDVEIRRSQHFIDALGEDAIREFEGKNVPNGSEKAKHRIEWAKSHKAEIENAYADYMKKEWDFTDEDVKDVLADTKFIELMNFIRDAMNYLNNGATTVRESIDQEATDKAVEQRAKAEGYDKWVDDLLNGIEEKRGIRNNKDVFTPSGNRRSWEALHDEPTLLTIVQIMSAQENGETFLGSSLKAVAQKQYRNISEVRADKGRLKTISEEEYKTLMGEFAERENDIITRIDNASPTYESNPFIRHSDIRSSIVDNVRRGLSKTAFLKDLQKYANTKGATAKDVDDIFDLVRDVANIPTGYFEAKPKRPVTFYEVKALLAPSDAPTDLISRLQDEGVNVVQYEAGNDEDRVAKLNQASEENNLKFSVSEEDENAPTPKEYQSTIAKLEEKVADLKSEFKRTDLKTADPKQTRIQAGRLLKRHDSNLTLQGDVVKAFNDIFKLYKKDGTKAFDEAYEIAQRTAVEVVNGIQVIHDEGADEYQAIKDYFKNLKGGIRITDEMKRNITDYGDFYRRYGRKLNLRNGDTGNIDSVYMELAELFPMQFTEDYVNPADQLLHMADVLDSYAPYYETLDGASEEMQDYVVEIASDIMETAYGLQTKITFADKKYLEKQKAVQEAYRKAREEALASREEELEKQRQRFEEKLKASVSKARKGTREQILNRAEKRKRLNQIAGIHKRLLEKLDNPKDTKHLPDGYAPLVSNVLSMFDFTTKRMEKWAERYGEPSARYRYLDELRKRLADMSKEDSPIAESGFEIDPDIIEIIEELKADVADTDRLSDLDSATLEDIYTLFKAFEHQLNTFNKAFDENNRQTVIENRDNFISETRDKKTRKDKQGTIGWLQRQLETNNTTPEDFFHLIGGTPEKLYKSIRKGFDKHILNVKSAMDYIQSVTEGKDVKKWSENVREYTTSFNETIKLTDAQLMSIYCLSKREQAQQHMYSENGGSGIVVVPQKVGKGLKAETLDRANVVVNSSDIQKWISQLSKEQIEVADRLQRYLSEDMSKLGNETSLKLYGYKKFTEKNYFPIQSSNDWLNSNFDFKGDSPVLKNTGMTKALNKHASNPIVIDDIFTVATKHISTMSLYNSLVPSLTDFQRFWNSKDKDHNTTVQKEFIRVYGEPAYKYVENFMGDLNGSYKRGFEVEGVDKLMSKYKQASIGLNLRVLFQQPTAVARAGAVMNPMYITKALGASVKTLKDNLKDMREHCPIALWKSWGFYNTDLARDMRSIMMDEKTLSDNFSKAYGIADDLTWSVIFKAVRYEVEAQNKNLKVGSDEYWEKVNERASKVFDRTQVVDSPFHRSQNMRAKDNLSKMVTAFMAEPTKTYNMLKTELTLAKREIQSGQKAQGIKRASRVVQVFVTNALLVSASSAVIDALRGVGGSGDDDKDKNWFERFLAHWWTNTKENINPLGLLPVFKDVQSVVQGYDVTRMDMQAIGRMVKSLQYMGEYIKEPENSKYTFKNEAHYLLQQSAYLVGLPLANLERDTRGVALSIAEAVGYDDLFFEEAKFKYQVNDKTKPMWADMYLEAKYKGNSKLAKKIKDYITSNDAVTEEYIEEREKKYKKDNKSASQQHAYDSSIQTLEASPIWNTSSEDNKEYYTGIVENLSVGIENQSTEYVTKLAKNGLTNEQVILYKLALKKVDKPSKNGNYGSYTNAEKEDAIRLLERYYNLTQAQKNILMGK